MGPRPYHLISTLSRVVHLPRWSATRSSPLIRNSVTHGDSERVGDLPKAAHHAVPSFVPNFSHSVPFTFSMTLSTGYSHASRPKEVYARLVANQAHSMRLLASTSRPEVLEPGAPACMRSCKLGWLAISNLISGGFDYEAVHLEGRRSWLCPCFCG